MESRSNVKGCTRHQSLVLKAITQLVEEHEGRFPTIRQVAVKMGKKESNTNGIRLTMIRMGEHGLLEQDARGWRLPKKGPSKKDLANQLRELIDWNSEVGKSNDAVWTCAKEMVENIDKG